MGRSLLLPIIGITFLFIFSGCDKRQLEVKSLFENSEIEKNDPVPSNFSSQAKIVLGSDERTVGTLTLKSQVVQSASQKGNYGNLVLESQIVLKDDL